MGLEHIWMTFLPYLDSQSQLMYEYSHCYMYKFLNFPTDSIQISRGVQKVCHDHH